MVAILIAIEIVTVGFGVFYALYIKYWPIKPTWVSVAIGTGYNCLAEMGAITTIWWFDGEGWLMILVPPIILLSTGLPMALIQQKKWKDVTKHNEDVIEVFTEK